MAVTTADIAIELGVAAPTSLQESQWQSWIDQALYLIGKRLDVATLDPADVDYVVLRAVVAHARNPEGSTQVDVAVDDGRVSKRQSSSAGEVVILDEWWDLLTPDGTASTGAFTISPYGAADSGVLDSGQRWY